MKAKYLAIMLATVISVGTVPVSVWGEEAFSEEVVVENEESISKYGMTSTPENVDGLGEEDLEQQTDERDSVYEENDSELVGVSDGIEFTQNGYIFRFESGIPYIKKYNGSSSYVTLPTKVTYQGLSYNVIKVGSGAFKNNTSLTSLVIPKQIKQLGFGVFENCTRLQSIRIQGDVESSDQCFRNSGTATNMLELIYENGVTKVSNLRFADSNLKRITFSNTVETIDSYAFRGCDNLQTISWGNRIKTIGYEAFENCSSLTELNLPASVKTIKGYAFTGCTQISSVGINGNIDSVTRGAFLKVGAGQNNVKVVFSNNVTKIPECMFQAIDDVWTRWRTDVCIHMTSLKVPDSVAEIGDGAFGGCADIEEVTLGKNIKVIGDGAFEYCEKLKSINMGRNVQKIERSAFNSCEKLTTVYYGGSREDRKGINIESHNDSLNNATWIYSNPSTTVKNRVTMYRLYNPNSGEHFYTGSQSERNHLVSVGWKSEGTGWTAPQKSNHPVYRLYNKNAGDHHYTMNAAEKNMLVSVGWNYEGIGWYSDDAKGIPLYRQYNPNAKAGSHNYTTSKAENDMLVRAGWKAEGIGWYGVK